ncbi:MAG: histidine phosphatase family protein [Paracoccus sp. (in: a-proteobacteria)]
MSLFDHPRFYLLRHGQTAHNAAGLIAGATDAPLTALGRQQAQAAARSLVDVPVGQIHASPLLRAWQTAQAVAGLRPGTQVIPAPLLAERNWGIWEGAPQDVLDRAATPEGGESAAAFGDRIRQGCAAIPAPAPDEAPPLLVAHSGTVREIFAALDLPFLRPPNCALIAVFRDQRGCWRADPPRAAADFLSNP